MRGSNLVGSSLVDKFYTRVEVSGGSNTLAYYDMVTIKSLLLQHMSLSKC
jgi:hypothetical protein